MNIQATTTAASSVDIRDLTVAFGSLPVIDRLNLEIQSGEFIVLLGPSGCGKSTLLNTIAGLQDAKSGEIHMGGRNVMELEPKDRGIAMVFQSYALYPTMTVERNLSFGLRVARMPKEEIERRVKRAAEILELTPLLKRSRAPCRAASASASPSAGRWCARWISSSSMSRCPTSMRNCAPNCGSRSSGCISGWAIP
jgi:multiple sugar transport system ATP-binding protein